MQFFIGILFLCILIVCIKQFINNNFGKGKINNNLFIDRYSRSENDLEFFKEDSAEDELSNNNWHNYPY